MAQVQFRPVPGWQRTTSYSATTRRWGVSSGIWGAGAGITALFILSVTPRIKQDILTKVPVLGEYYKDNTPACDKPF